MMQRSDKPISKLLKWFEWLDRNILLLLVSVLIVLIPLLPKIPLADILPGYIVRVRTEDFLIALAFGLWGVQLLRRKVSLQTPLTKIILAYLVIGFLSSVSAIFITKTVPQSVIHVQKLFLHFFRRVEYFSLFFLAASAVRSVQQIKRLLALFLFAVFAVNVYGLGQKYLYWPVYSTMNREFSKGLRLFLTEHARVQSTFGGHYDYAAFLVIGLPFVLAMLFTVKNRWMKFGLFFTYLAGLWGMMMTASRSSFLALVLSFVILFVYWLRVNGFVWSLIRGVFAMSMMFVFLFTFGSMSERFAQIFKGNESYASLQATIDQMKSKAQLPLVAPPKEGISIDDVNRAAEEAAKKALAQQAQKEGVIDVTDTMPSVGAGQNLPADVYENIPAAVISTKSAEGKDIEVVIPRVFSENAHKLGLSAAIRLDTLWPFAIRGFLRNPLLGSGYSTLTKYSIGEFTEAESTDNDFLRTLGETGALGFITFYGTMIVGLRYMIKTAKAAKDKLYSLYAVIMVAVTAGLFVNAIYIDVFVSSKIIQTYWILTGLGIAWGVMLQKQEKPIQIDLKPAAKKKVIQAPRMNILMLTPYLPYPLFSGGQIRTYNLLKNLSKKHQITLFALIKHESERAYIPELEKYCRKVQVFKRSERPFTLKNIFRAGFSSFPFLVIRNLVDEVVDAVRKELQKEQYDLIHAETFYMMPNIPKTSIPVLLVEQTIEYLGYLSFTKSSKLWFLKPLFYLDIQKIRKWEEYYWKNSSRLIVMSEEDKRFIQDSTHFKQTIDVVANGVDVEYFRQTEKRLPEQPTVLFVGTFRWLPNVEAVRFLVNEVWPLVKQRIANARLHIVGNSPTKEVYALAKDRTDVQVSGNISDIREAYATAYVLVAPVFSGKGTRYKVLEALATKTPVVGTQLAVEGLNIESGKHALIGDTSEAIANHTIEVLLNPSLRQRLAENGERFVFREYNWESISSKLNDIYKEVAGQRANRE